ncbi:hypothetical protein BDW02DRAFT_641686 [Decorospora gaudefroyi]|uniref:Uncharacterized protein n=1 Tax=Decorospora gaudefroyi TaxID=184978 RepID=A0A6A5K0M7_9PLEO|nr:hypothetical protein BDW02DRAFT_641686 [Decorospora gaudefroyi]
MSQPSTPFSGATIDTFLPSMNYEQSLSQSDFEKLFAPDASDQPVFSSNNSDVLDELNFGCDNTSLVHVDSSNPSTISTPDFSTYSFGHPSPGYPTPSPNSPHAYPIEHQPCYRTNAHHPSLNHRPLPVRSHTNNTFLHPAQPPQSYTRRRSLSHSDVDRIAATTTIPNPTFIRLQAPRARSTTPEEKRRTGPYPHHGPSTSQGPGPGPGPRGNRPTKPLQRSPLVGRMLPTPIGTPLNRTMQVSYDHSHQHHTTTNNPIIIRHMTHPHDLTRSAHIIEIGALAVTNPNRSLDPRLAHTTDRARILQKLEDIERHFKAESESDALRGCSIIRDALMKGGAEGERGVKGLEVASSMLGGSGSGSGIGRCDDDGDGDGDEIMDSWMRENGGAECGFGEVGGDEERNDFGE